MRDLTHRLSTWLDGRDARIGQILISHSPCGWDLMHAEDSGREDLLVYYSPEEARRIANFTDAGGFRPLKTAPTLAHGWRLRLEDVAAVRRALDYFYPAMLGCGESFERGALPAVPLRETLGRQTGMYRITQQITDEQARATIDRFCAGCLKQRLWEIAGANPAPPRTGPREWPLLCHEACNLLVAEMRRVVKAQ